MLCLVRLSSRIADWGTVSYADFIVASLLHFVKLLGPELYDRFVAHDKAFDDLYQACAKWLERDDH